MKHANPWSVYSRFTVLPLLVLSFWSRVWLGWWSLMPILISLSWMIFNPIVFGKPKSTKNWASKSVLGERIYINRDKMDIPEGHKNGINNLLNAISFLGLCITIWAIIVFSIYGAVLGLLLALILKACYLNRMVKLYETMKNRNEVYKSWEY